MAHPLAVFTVLPYLLSFLDKRKFSYLIFSLANEDIRKGISDSIFC